MTQACCATHTLLLGLGTRFGPQCRHGCTVRLMLATATHSVVISADCTMQNSTRSLVPVHITVLHVRVMQIQVKSSSWGSLRPSLCPTYCKVHTVYNSHLAACLQGCGSILERVPVYRTYYSHPECVHLSWEAGDKDAGNTSRQRLAACGPGPGEEEEPGGSGWG